MLQTNCFQQQSGSTYDWCSYLLKKGGKMAVVQYLRLHYILQFLKHNQFSFFSQNWPRYGQTQESGVGRWLIIGAISN
jgi:hypothetical protein